MPTLHNPAECVKCCCFFLAQDARGFERDVAHARYQRHIARRIRLGADGIPATARVSGKPRRAA